MSLVYWLLGQTLTTCFAGFVLMLCELDKDAPNPGLMPATLAVGIVFGLSLTALVGVLFGMLADD